MNLKERTNALIKVGNFINRFLQNSPKSDENQLHIGLSQLINTAYLQNNWFTDVNIKQSLNGIASFLNEDTLHLIAQENLNSKKVLIMCAGNIPMVAFHDILCVLVSNHIPIIKLSSDDNVLIPFTLKLLCHYEPKFENKIYFAEGITKNFDAVIATGSNNSAMYFEKYFGKHPNIIRKNRTSIAVLNGNESINDLQNLGKDIFTYFGLGCRNVTQLLVPNNYDFKLFFESIIDYNEVINNKKYANNYDYHKAIYLLENHKFLDNNFLMVKENDSMFAPVGTIHFKKYSSTQAVDAYIEANQKNIQCIVSNNYIAFGQSQKPKIIDYADNVNTMEFLLSL